MTRLEQHGPRAGGGSTGWRLALGAMSWVVLGVGVVGCTSSTPPKDPATTGPEPSASTPSGTEAAAPAPAKPAPRRKPAPVVDPVARLHQPFAEATLDASSDQDQRLPDQLVTGKPVGKIYDDVKARWDSIRFLTPAGTPIRYTATVETERGAIEITLRPEIAPNHVRSFVALSRAGYYDGLMFDRIVHQESNDPPGTFLDLLEAGCPRGLGKAGYGSIGYWLKPEYDFVTKHEDGTVGSTHDEEPDTEACKFYITLGKAPLMDNNFTIFGKVTKGLDVVRTIFREPVDKEDNQEDRPKKPVVIKKVTITTDEAK